jgi:glutaredoxin-dependent peroxiredoxin
MAAIVGQPAPFFSLYDTTKHKWSLPDFKGQNLVILFFPLAFSSVCTRELCEMRDRYTEFTKLNTEVVGVSVDSLYANAKFKEINKIPFPLLADFNKEASLAYDVLIQNFSYDMKGVSTRATFVIDKNGVLRYAEVLPLPSDYPDMAALQKAVAALS